MKTNGIPFVEGRTKRYKLNILVVSLFIETTTFNYFPKKTKNNFACRSKSASMTK